MKTVRSVGQIERGPATEPLDSDATDAGGCLHRGDVERRQPALAHHRLLRAAVAAARTRGTQTGTGGEIAIGPRRRVGQCGSSCSVNPKSIMGKRAASMAVGTIHEVNGSIPIPVRTGQDVASPARSMHAGTRQFGSMTETVWLDQPT